MTVKLPTKEDLGHKTQAILGKEFQRLIPASGPASQNADNVKKLVFCSGKVYYDFIKEVKEKKIEDKIAIARVEQVSSLTLLQVHRVKLFGVLGGLIPDLPVSLRPGTTRSEKIPKGPNRLGPRGA